MSALAPSVPVNASQYAAQAPDVAAARLRREWRPIDPGFSATPGMTSALASLMTVGHQLGRAQPAATTLNIHPQNGVTIKTTPTNVPPNVGYRMLNPPAKQAAAGTASSPGSVSSGAGDSSTGDAASNPASLLPGYMTPSQESAYVQQALSSIYGPIANSLAALFQSRSNVLQGAINSYTPIYGQLTGQYAPESQANYGEAMQSQAAIDSMLQSALGGQGAQAAAQLAKEIGSTGVAAPVANALEGTQAARYQGEQGAAAARGAASLSQLLGQGVNAADYGAKLPGIAGAAGLLATRQGQAQITNDEMNALAQMAGNEGTTAGQLYADLRQMMNNEAMLELYYGPRGAAAGQNAATNRAKLPIDQQNANAHTTAANAAAQNAGTNAAKVPILQQNANSNTTRAGAAVTSAGAAAANAATNKAKVPILQQNANAHTTSADATASRAAAYAAAEAARTKSGGLSLAQASKYRGIALSGVSNAFKSGMTYQQAIQAGREAGVPDQVLLPTVNATYGPGVRGRPAGPPLNPKQQAIISSIFTSPFAQLTGKP